MSKITKSAQGEDCLIRLSCCNHDPETTVLAHYRLAGYCGMGKKPNDLFGAFACSACHDSVDGRTHPEGYSRLEMKVDFLEGVLRTLYKHEKEGRIIVL